MRDLVDLRQEWLTEQAQWQAWRAALRTYAPLAEITATFDKADHTIATALGLILSQLQPLLALQEQAGTLQTTLNTLSTELASLNAPAQRETTPPPMFSAAYGSQFRAGLRRPLNVKLDDIVRAEQTFFAQQG